MQPCVRRPVEKDAESLQRYTRLITGMDVICVTKFDHPSGSTRPCGRHRIEEGLEAMRRDFGPSVHSQRLHSQHQTHTVESLVQMLGNRCVGVLCESADERDEVGHHCSNKKDPNRDNDPYANDPKRDEGKLLFRPIPPFIGGTLPKAMCDNFYTDTDAFYVRNHAPVPKNSDGAEITVRSVLSGRDESFTLCPEDLEGLPQTSMGVCLQCCGNRIDELHGHKYVER